MFNSGTLRRRVLHDDVGGKKYDSITSSRSDGLHEPLLDHLSDSEEDEGWKESKRKEESAWTQIFTKLLAQWIHLFATLFLSSGSWAGHVLFRTVTRGQVEETVTYTLTSTQQEKLQQLQQRLDVPFDGTRLEHQMALKELWQEAFPDVTLTGLVSEQWKEMGWQGKDPSTDFRGGGFISLENLIFFAKKYPKLFRTLLFKQEGRRSTWEYPFAVAGINISFMLIQMLDLRSDKVFSPAGSNFINFLEEDEMAFDKLYCVAFMMMDAQWLAMGASYMEFNAVLKATQVQLEREMLLDDVHRVEDLPAYNLLCN